MTRKLFLLALLGAAAPALATPATEESAQNAANWEVMLSQYPPRARAAGEQGRVGFRINLDREGFATACEVTRGSGFPRLDDETCRLIMTRGAFKGIHDGNVRRTNAVYEGVINWKLPKGEATAATPVRTAQAAAPERLICRRKLRTGSLASYERTCLTKSDWQRYSDRERDFWQEQQGSKGSTHGN